MTIALGSPWTFTGGTGTGVAWTGFPFYSAGALSFAYPVNILTSPSSIVFQTIQNNALNTITVSSPAPALPNCGAGVYGSNANSAYVSLPYLTSSGQGLAAQIANDLATSQVNVGGILGNATTLASQPSTPGESESSVAQACGPNYGLWYVTYQDSSDNQQTGSVTYNGADFSFASVEEGEVSTFYSYLMAPDLSAGFVISILASFLGQPNTHVFGYGEPVIPPDVAGTVEFTNGATVTDVYSVIGNYVTVGADDGNTYVIDFTTGLGHLLQTPFTYNFVSSPTQGFGTNSTTGEMFPLQTPVVPLAHLPPPPVFPASCVSGCVD